MIDIGISINNFFQILSITDILLATNSFIVIATTAVLIIISTTYNIDAVIGTATPIGVDYNAIIIKGSNIVNAAPIAAASNPFVERYSFDFSINLGAKNNNAP